MKTKRIRQQFADTMLEVGKTDPRLVVLIGDISHFILQPFARACPDRFYNIGICEPAIISMAAGLSKAGFYPVAHTIAPFIIERSFEQIKLDFCYQGFGGTLVTVGSVFDYSNLGCTHHCYSDFALIGSLPNTEMIYPASCNEFDILFKETYKDGKLTLFRIPESQHEQPIKASDVKLGKAIKIKDGKDLSIIVTGPQLKNAVEAEKELSAKGWDIEIMYVHTISPLDKKAIRKSVEKTGQALVIEEHHRQGGLGSRVLENVYDIKGLKFCQLALDPFIRDYGLYEDLCKNAGLCKDGIVKTVKDNFRK